jgi:hypothetical protein
MVGLVAARGGPVEHDHHVEQCGVSRLLDELAADLNGVGFRVGPERSANGRWNEITLETAQRVASTLPRLEELATCAGLLERTEHTWSDRIREVELRLYIGLISDNAELVRVARRKLEGWPEGHASIEATAQDRCRKLLTIADGEGRDAVVGALADRRAQARELLR